MHNINQIEIIGGAQSFYTIFLANQYDKIFCGAYMSKWSAFRVARHVSTVLKLPLFCFGGVKLGILDYLFEIFNYIVIAVLMVGLFYVNREVIEFVLINLL